MDKVVQVGVGVLIIKDNKLLMSKRKGAHGEGTYGTCGGHLEFGETPEEGITREILEETGLKVKSLKFLCVSNVIEYDKHYIDISFLGEVEEGEPKVTEPDRIESWGWFDLDSLPAPIFKPVELAIKSYLSNQVYNS